MPEMMKAVAQSSMKEPQGRAADTHVAHVSEGVPDGGSIPPGSNLEFVCDRSRHLVCIPYSVSNLHAMARQLGIKPCWFHAGHHPHYDIPKRRIAEVMERCRVVSSRDILGIIRPRVP